MHTKKDAGFLITIVLSMLILAYISFITVYEQILSQNNGFFNVIIYGVVLILVFIFITLFLRVINVKIENKESSPVLKVLIYVGIFSIFAFFAYVTTRYSSSVSPLESSLYKTAGYINDGLLPQAMDIHDDILGYPANFVYGYIISLIFGVTGASESVYLIINTAAMLLLALFLFKTVELISNIACATFSVIIFLLIPNDIFLVYSYNAEIFVGMLFIITVYLCELLIYKRFKSPSSGRIIALFAGVTGGLLLSCEPAMILSLIALCIWIIKARRQKTACIIITMAVSIAEFLGIIVFKALMMGLGFVEVFLAEVLCFLPTHSRIPSGEEFSVINMFTVLTDRLNNPSKFLNDNSYFLITDSGNTISASQTLALSIIDQFIILSMLILCVLLVVYVIRVNYDKIMPVLTLIITSFVIQVLGGCNQVLYVYFIVLFILAGSTTLYYMFLNHHPDYAVYITNKSIRAENDLAEDAERPEQEETEDESDEDSTEDLLRARALVFIGENEELYNKIKTEERVHRSDNSIAATRIKTMINEDGEYDSVEEDVEFLDSPDEVFEAKPIHEVKAIPSTRPVEIVKPVLADDYFEKSQDSVSENSEPQPVIALVQKVTKADDEYFDEPDDFNIPSSTKNIEEVNEYKADLIKDAKKETLKEAKEETLEKPENETIEVTVKETTEEKPPIEGFVFRKKGDKPADATVSETKKGKDKKEKKPEKAPKEVKQKKDKKALKPQKPLNEIKPGEPLPNPLEGPKPPKKESLDFDFDSDGSDDFDF